ncbi:uncharacterized protein N7498_009666 [Penicillium cinerascens]|uniref:Uncharacterized protein n=1 Tax=Penicillium cinerascens TaxID=70096 RepID=A0A9W9JAF0_9EURO|nr:uncharacterized protein N7498_009666 [Penicillium cinerascens]KAJ5190681.1 hypothetical protein N7498_009666 [Penicillium cinerascens]
MTGHLFTAAAPLARIACSTSTATLKTQITRQPTWQLTVRPYPSHLRLKLEANNYVIQKLAPPCRGSMRFFSSTPAPSFTVSAAQQSSPFRLSSDKHGSSRAFEEDRYSQYKPKRQWPPDMSKLSPKHQFRLERKYRRRAALKYARPNFIKGVQLAQWGIIGFVVIYAVLFMNWDTKDTPFDGIREKVFSSIRAVFSAPPPPGPKPAEERNESS